MNQISIDDNGDYIASCSDDGKVTKLILNMENKKANLINYSKYFTQSSTELFNKDQSHPDWFAYDYLEPSALWHIGSFSPQQHWQVQQLTILSLFVFIISAFVFRL